MIAECHRGTVQNDKVMVGVKVLSEPDVVAIVAPERGRHAKILARFRQKPPENLPLPSFVRGTQLIVGMAQLLGPHAVGAECPVVGVIQLSVLHFFPLGHVHSSFRSRPPGLLPLILPRIRAQHNSAAAVLSRCGCCLFSPLPSRRSSAGLFIISGTSSTRLNIYRLLQ